jgi:serine/threonine protein kinase/tetratricopeptide (TPR) repeat protein
MTSDTWTREDWELIERIFDEISELPTEEWRPALNRYFSGDSLIRQEVEKLLDYLKHEQNSDNGSTLESMNFDCAALEQLVAQLEHGRVLLGEVLAGRFEIIELLGHGGMADVYKAYDRSLQQDVALKVVRKAIPAGTSWSKEFENLAEEVKNSQRVVDRNVCQVFDIGQDIRAGSKIIFLTMQFLRGETLSARLKRTGRLDTSEALEIAKQLCKALQAAHKAGVLHRDFKCNNIMLINSGTDVRAVVTDFGIACRMLPEKHLADSGTSLNTSRTLPGTPAYMSPEQVRGHELTKASDIYSLGLVLYEMVTGRRPFCRDDDDSPLAERDRRLTEDPIPPAKIVPRLSKNWNEAILRCLEREPDKRFRSARAVKERIDPAPPPPTTKRLLIRVTVVLASILLIVANLQSQWFERFLHPLPRQKDVAVLSFSFAGTNPEYKAISSGFEKFLPEVLSQCCSSEGSVRFVSFSTVREQEPGDAKHQASAWGANLLVTGELGNTDGVLKLNIEVKDANFKVLRSRVIKIPEAKATTLEDHLLEQVAEMLELKIPSGYKLPVDQTTKPRAYQLYEEGRGYLAQQQSLQLLDQAIAKLKEVTQLDSNFGIAYADLADAYYWKYSSYTGDRRWLDEAQKEIVHSIAINNKLFSAHSVLGSILQKKGDLNGAISEFTQAINLDLGSDETRCQLATAYDKNNQKPYAEKLLQAALKRNPKNWIAEDCLGALYYRHAQYADAEAYFIAATRNAPGSPLAFLNLGGIYLSQTRYPEAETALRIAINLKPTASGFSNLGTAQFYLKHYAAAAESFTDATQLRPGDHRLWRNLGDAYALAGNDAKAAEAYHRAIQELNRVLDINPTDCSMLESMSLYYAKLGDKQRASQTLAQAQAMGTPGRIPELLFTRVLIYELIGQRNQALAALRSTVAAGYSRQEIQNTPELDQLRSDKRYKKIMDQRNLRQPM